MIQQFLIKILLSPLSLLYGIGVSLRNFFYRKNIFKGISFDIPIIAVGNLTVGGAGKTPHIEYLIMLFQEYINVATLSRGYKRKTKGFLKVDGTQNAEVVGDEPLQFKRKFPEVNVTVAENRTFAVSKILMDKSDTQVILLDDAYQHRAIKAGLNILLTEFSHPFTEDYLLPSGRLREWRSAYLRANIIVVSKCPPQLSVEEKEAFIKAINPVANQRIYFSYFEYFAPYFILNPQYKAPLQKDWDVILICAIARAEYLVEYLEEQVNSVTTLEYEDHRYFTKHDVSNLKRIYDEKKSDKKLIITTEKDAMRLELHKDYLIENKLPIFVIPVKVAFHFNEGQQFDYQVKQFMLDFKV